MSKCPSADWWEIGSLSGPCFMEDLAPPIAIMVDLSREKLCLHLIRPIVFP